MAVVCLCFGVSERRVAREIDRGAESVEDIAVRCRAGGGCFGCHETIERLIDERAPRSVRVA